MDQSRDPNLPRNRSPSAPSPSVIVDPNIRGLCAMREPPRTSPQPARDRHPVLGSADGAPSKTIEACHPVDDTPRDATLSAARQVVPDSSDQLWETAVRHTTPSMDIAMA